MAAAGLRKKVGQGDALSLRMIVSSEYAHALSNKRVYGNLEISVNHSEG